MPIQLDRLAINDRMLELTDMLSAGCDPEFDAQQEELEREFQELRYQLRHFE
jgi:ABC-type phosphate transport system auxiliary subunit